MKVLFLDDDEARHERFRQAVHDSPAVRYVHTAREARNAIAREKFDICFLDHDLGLTGSIEDDGYKVVQYIVGLAAEHSDHVPGQVIVHSANPVGSERMVNALRAAGIRTDAARFGTTEFDMTVKRLDGLLGGPKK